MTDMVKWRRSGRAQSRKRVIAAEEGGGIGRDIRLSESHAKIFEFLLSAGGFVTASQIYHGLVLAHGRITHAIIYAALTQLASSGVIEKVRTCKIRYSYRLLKNGE